VEKFHGTPSLYPRLAVAVSMPGLLDVAVSTPKLLDVAVSTPDRLYSDGTVFCWLFIYVSSIKAIFFYNLVPIVESLLKTIRSQCPFFCCIMFHWLNISKCGYNIRVFSMQLLIYLGLVSFRKSHLILRTLSWGATLQWFIVNMGFYGTTLNGLIENTLDSINPKTKYAI